MIGAFTVGRIDGHKREVGAASLTNFQNHLKLEIYPIQIGIWCHVNAIPRCREMIASYRAAVLSTDPSASKPPTRKSRSVSADVSHHFHWASSCIVLSAFIYSLHQTEQPLVSAL